MNRARDQSAELGSLMCRSRKANNTDRDTCAGSVGSQYASGCLQAPDKRWAVSSVSGCCTFSNNKETKMRLNFFMLVSIGLLLGGWLVPAIAADGGKDGMLDLRTVVTILSTLLTLFIGFYARSLENKVEDKMDKALADAILNQFDSSYKIFAASVKESNDKMSHALSQVQKLELQMVRDRLTRDTVRDIIASEVQPLKLEIVKLTEKFTNLTDED